MKKEYEVRIVVTEFYKTFVEAESAEEAERIAEGMLADGDLYEDSRSMDTVVEPTGRECDEEAD